MSLALEIRDLFRVYSTPEGDAAALQGLSLIVRRGEIVTVLGPSGAGKTTLLRIVAALDRPSAGTVRVFGLDVGRLNARALGRYRAATLGYVEQHYSRALSPELSARELVGLKLHIQGVSRRERFRRADELLERVGLSAKAAVRPAELSGGEQQRIAVCAALVHRPPLLLADEPTGELDRDNAQIVYETIRELVRGDGATALLVSHDPSSTAIADRTVQVRDGRVSEESTRQGGGSQLIVVGRGGWVRLPEELLRRVGVGMRARATTEAERIVITAAAEDATHDDRRRPVSGPDMSAGVSRRNSPRGVLVQASGVSKTYGRGANAVEAITGFTASFDSGRFYTITGPSGSGKTTLLRLFAGLALPSTGDVKLLGRSLAELNREGRAAMRRGHLAIIGQQFGLIPFMSARENVELGVAVREMDGTRDRAIQALAAVGLADRMEQHVSRLSSGEQARVAIARALAIGAALILADEPTSRLDQANGLAIATLFRQLVSEYGLSIICATHDPVVIEQSDEELELVRIRANAGRRRTGMDTSTAEPGGSAAPTS
jgi:ABC-type lipoprotein export system ATPase subunit